MERVAVLVPVLNRPHRVRPLAENLLEQSPTVWLMFIVSPHDDATTAEIARHTGAYQRPGFLPVDWEPGPGDYARKINAGYRLARDEGFDWVFTGADDLGFHPGWLDQALGTAAATGACVVGTDDMWNPVVRQGRHSTHSLVRVSYVEEQGGGWDGPGVLLHEGYDHQYVDNELCVAAQMRGCFAFAHSSKVEHLHPFANKSERDSTYDKALARGRQDNAIFRQRMRNAQAQHRRHR